MINRARIAKSIPDQDRRTNAKAPAQGIQTAQAPPNMSSPTSFTRSQAVVLLEVGPSPLFFTWSDAIVVSRTRSGVFRLCARKLTEALGTRSRHRWATLTDVKKIKTPEQFVAGVTRCADKLHVKIEWDVALAKLATLDWPFSLAVARFISCPVQKLPPSDVLLRQPHLDRLGKVSVRVKGEDYTYRLDITTPAWIRICSGEPASFTTIIYGFAEDEPVNAYWRFNPGGDDSLVIDGFESCSWSIDDARVTGPLISGFDLGQLIRQSYRSKENE